MYAFVVLTLTHVPITHMLTFLKIPEVFVEAEIKTEIRSPLAVNLFLFAISPV